jgi:hypothetical protein
VTNENAKEQNYYITHLERRCQSARCMCIFSSSSIRVFIKVTPVIKMRPELSALFPLQIFGWFDTVNNERRQVEYATDFLEREETM